MTEKDENELLQYEDFGSDDQQQDTYALMMNMMSSLSRNMAAMNESLKHIHGADDSDASAMSKKSLHSHESGISTDVNYLLNEGEPSETSKAEESAGEDNVVDDITQSLDESEKTAEAVSVKISQNCR